VNATVTVALPRPEPPPAPVGRIPRIVRLLALAHDIERRVRSGELDDLAAAARAYGLTRARVTQIVNLTLLAPKIQEKILGMEPVVHGRDKITERRLRAIAANPVWTSQAVSWNALSQSSPGPREPA
jgi:hypothetical protein